MGLATLGKPISLMGMSHTFSHSHRCMWSQGREGWVRLQTP